MVNEINIQHLTEDTDKSLNNYHDSQVPVFYESVKSAQVLRSWNKIWEMFSMNMESVK